MANKRISELTSITGANLADADLLVVVDVSDTTMAASGTNKKITMAELAKDSALTDNLVAKSTLTTNGDLLTRAAGEPARITRADLAADSAFTSRYKPLASDGIILSAGVFVPTNGTSQSFVASTGIQRTGAIMFPDASTTSASAQFVWPAGWSTATVTLYLSNAGAGAGNVVVGCRVLTVANGDTFAATGLSPGSDATFAAPAQDALGIRSFTGSPLTVTAGSLARLSVLRFGAEAGDTLTNDLALIAAQIVRAS